MQLTVSRRSNSKGFICHLFCPQVCIWYNHQTLGVHVSFTLLFICYVDNFWCISIFSCSLNRMTTSSAFEKPWLHYLFSPPFLFISFAFSSLSDTHEHTNTVHLLSHWWNQVINWSCIVFSFTCIYVLFSKQTVHSFLLVKFGFNCLFCLNFYRMKKIRRFRNWQLSFEIRNGFVHCIKNS